MKPKIWVAVIAACAAIVAAYIAHKSSTEVDARSPSSRSLVTQPHDNQAPIVAGSSTTDQATHHDVSAIATNGANQTVDASVKHESRTEFNTTTINNDYRSTTTVAESTNGKVVEAERQSPTSPIPTPPPTAAPKPKARNVDEEDNGTLSNANPIDPGVAVPGTVEYSGEDTADWFVLTVAEACTLTVKVTNTTPAARDRSVHVQLFEQDVRLDELNWIPAGGDRITKPQLTKPGAKYFIKVDSPNRGARVKYTVECLTQKSK